jgi:hypothetical protein
MEDINVRSVRYPLLVDQKFEKLALKMGRTKRQLFIQMVDYFHKSKKDPADLNDEILKNTLMKNHQQYIGFIKTQENMLLVPMKSVLDRIGESQRQVLDLFNTEVLKHNVDVLNIVSRKDATNLIKLSPMNTSRGRNEEHSKKMGQFDRVAFKQRGESLFDSLFEFDRQLKDTMAYANTQKNGSLQERVEMDALETEIDNSLDSLRKNEGREIRPL